MYIITGIKWLNDQTNSYYCPKRSVELAYKELETSFHEFKLNNFNFSKHLFWHWLDAHIKFNVECVNIFLTLETL